MRHDVAVNMLAGLAAMLVCGGLAMMWLPLGVIAAGLVCGGVAYLLGVGL